MNFSVYRKGISLPVSYQTIVRVIYKTTIYPCIEYCWQIWCCSPDVHLEIPDKIQIWLSKIMSFTLAFLQIFSWQHFWCAFLSEYRRDTWLATSLHYFSVTITKYDSHFYPNRFFSRTFHFWNSLPISCFQITPISKKKK